MLVNLVNESGSCMVKCDVMIARSTASSRHDANSFWLILCGGFNRAFLDIGQSPRMPEQEAIDFGWSSSPLALTGKQVALLVAMGFPLVMLLS